MIHKRRFLAPDDYTPVAYGYGRVSHSSQVEKGNSIPDQQARISAYYDLRRMDERSDLARTTWGCMFGEPKAQSAFSKPLRMRPAGKEIIEVLRPGDHVIIDRLDRMVRSVEDFLDIDRWFGERGISLHIVNMAGASIDTSTAMGRFMLTNFALHAEFESLIKGERIRDARARLRARKLDAGVGVPIFVEVVGCEGGKTSGSGGKREFRPWSKEVFERINWLIDREGKGYRATCTAINAERKRMRVEPPKFNPTQISRMYWFWKAWEAAGCPDLNEIKFGELVNNYRAKHDTKPGEEPDEGVA